MNFNKILYSSEEFNLSLRVPSNDIVYFCSDPTATYIC